MIHLPKVSGRSSARSPKRRQLYKIDNIGEYGSDAGGADVNGGVDDEDDIGGVGGQPEKRADMPKKIGEWGPRRRM